MIVRKCIAVVRHKIIAKLFIGPCISIKQIYCRRDTLQTGISSLNTNLRERNVVDYTFMFYIHKTSFVICRSILYNSIFILSCNFLTDVG